MSNKEKRPAPSQNEPCEVMTFQFSESSQPIRNVFIDGEPYFVAIDVANALGYEKPHRAIELHCRYSSKRGVPHPQNPQKTLEVLVIPESDVYRLIMRSTLPAAQQFEQWVVEEVLPSLRKRGFYQVNRPSSGDYVDARNVPYTTVKFNGYRVRCIAIDSEQWYSVNDINRAMHTATGSVQIVKKLNAVEELSIKIWLFGNTHPAWFTNQKGASLMLSVNRSYRSQNILPVFPVN